MSKVCRVCGELKPLSEFYKHKGHKDGHVNECKSCRDKYFIEYKKSKKGVVSIIYADQKHNSRGRGHPMPSYSKKELKDWLYSQKKFHELYDKWKISGYDRWLKPSVDRLDDYKPYTLDNIRIVTWRDNAYRYYDDAKNGVNNKRCKAVLQFTLDGEFIAEHHSVSKASRVVGTGSSHISRACNGVLDTAKGFIWRYKENN